MSFSSNERENMSKLQGSMSVCLFQLIEFISLPVHISDQGAWIQMAYTYYSSIAESVPIDDLNQGRFN